MSDSKSNSKGFPETDPYEALGLAPGASEAEIVKAYRKLALKLHPDKQKGLSETEKNRADHRFQEIQQARSFLLDAEHQEIRRKYDAKRASDELRRQADAAREKGMSARRKRMREELKRQEEELRSKYNKDDHRKLRREDRNNKVEELRRQGTAMREAYADRAMEKADREDSKDRAQQKCLVEDRQIRLKWSRKKMRGKMSPSEDSIARLLSRFGSVEAVEMLGSKGNAALVTFASPESCGPCVDAYANSDEMRATFVGLRREREQEDEQKIAEAEIRSKRGPTERDHENVEDWKVRRAAERERILREMEREESGHEEVRNAAPLPEKKRRTAPFPPLFPSTEEYRGLSPLEKLEKAEESILKDILSTDAMRHLRFAR